MPFFGICLGMQCAVIECARNKLGLAGANSAEFNAHAAHKLIVFMPEINAAQMGGTMRLGARPTIIRRKLPLPADAPPPAAGEPAAVRVRSLASELYGRDVKGALRACSGLPTRTPRCCCSSRRTRNGARSCIRAWCLTPSSSHSWQRRIS